MIMVIKKEQKDKIKNNSYGNMIGLLSDKIFLSVLLTHNCKIICHSSYNISIFFLNALQKTPESEIAKQSDFWGMYISLLYFLTH